MSVRLCKYDYNTGTSNNRRALFVYGSCINLIPGHEGLGRTKGHTVVRITKRATVAEPKGEIKKKKKWI